MTCISSSRMVYTGKERRCCPMVFSREKALAPSAFLLADSAFIFAKWALNCPCERWPPASSASSSAFAASCACCASCCSPLVRPVISAILEPAISQNLARLFVDSFFSLIRLTSSEPLRAMTAMSEVGSFSGSTMSPPLMPTTLPSRKGGLVSCTNNRTRLSSSVSKSRLISLSLATPDVSSRFSSHAFMSFSSSFMRLVCAKDIILPSFRVRLCRSAARFWKKFSSPTKGSAPSRSAAPPNSSWSYQSRSIWRSSSSCSRRSISSNSSAGGSLGASSSSGLKSGERSATSPRLGGALAALLQLVLFQLGVSAGLGAVSNCTRPMPPVPGRPPTDAPLGMAAAGSGVSDAPHPLAKLDRYVPVPASDLLLVRPWRCVLSSLRDEGGKGVVSHSSSRDCRTGVGSHSPRPLPPRPELPGRTTSESRSHSFSRSLSTRPLLHSRSDTRVRSAELRALLPPDLGRS
mmetsp:Transcript_14776/g.39218  ORF Transcript_14776/g.39218 Transcript_14776/m.39218 type:complete len:463 (-) Transcript_14776:2336-3724(-)